MKIASLVWDRLEADATVDDEVAYLVLAAIDGADALATLLDEGASASRPPERPVADEAPVAARLTGIRVAGFRGIGEPRDITFDPRPGLTVISGRNGSGKSSFAEALDIALRGTTSRADQSELWASWRNLHQPEVAVRVGLAIDGSPALEVGVEWVDDVADWRDHKAFTQVKGEKRQPGRDALGWGEALTLYPPLLSYEELGHMFNARPSDLYDAINRVLGMGEFEQAKQRLDDAAKATSPKLLVSKAKSLARAVLDGIDDDRAAVAKTLLNKHKGAGADDIRQLVAGGASVDPHLSRLHQLKTLDAPDPVVVLAAREAVVSASEALAAAGGESGSEQDEALELLRRAVLFHETHGDGDCPVCGKGSLDEAWAAKSAAMLAAHRERQQRLAQLRATLQAAEEQWGTARPPAPGILAADVDLASLPSARDAWAALRSSTDIDENAVTALLDSLASAVEALKREAASEFTRRQDAWAPAIEPLVEWLKAVDEEAAAAPRLALLKQASGWLAKTMQQVRAERLQPIADGARHIWSKLRQESNVELGSIELTGSKTTRKLVLSGEVDGTPKGALAVMSQGELHALALALFIPRATLPGSPFGFIVLDDPIQAMDPSKIDGLVEVLFELAETRQVVVFSHDDRLPAALRRSAQPARILEIIREPNSTVSVVSGKDPVQRYLDDALAVLKAGELTDDVRRRVLPGLLRFAVEHQAHECYVVRELDKGVRWADIDAAWSAQGKTSEKVAAALGLDQPGLSVWLKKESHRKRALGAVTSGAHGTLQADPAEAREDVRKLLRELGAEL